MDEGLFTLIFIVILVLMSVMDAMGRRRQKQRQMEEMEQEEGAGPGTARPGRPQPDRPGRGAEEPAAAGQAEGERETADTMVPEDFWAILTGEEPPQRERPSGAQRGAPPAEAPPGQPGAGAPARPGERGPVGPGEPAAGHRGEPQFGRAETDPDRREPDQFGRRADPSPPREPHIPMPGPEDRISAEREEARRRAEEARSRSEEARRRVELAGRTRPEEPAPATRRSARWMEGLEREEPDRTLEPLEAEEARIYGDMEEPWDQLGDIAEGDLTEAEGPVRDPARERPGEARRPGVKRRGRGRGQYTRLLESGDQEDLRKAIVLREVLGQPVGFRDPGDDLPR